MAKTTKAKSKTRAAKTATKPKAAATEKSEKVTRVVLESTATARRPRLANVKFAQQLVLGRLLAELIGTFVLTFVVLAALNGKFAFMTLFVEQGVLQATGQTAPIFTATALLAAFTVVVLVLVIGKLSGAHVNPAVTLALWSAGKIKATPALFYIIAQTLGAMLAVVAMSRFVDASVAVKLDPNFGWGVFAAEALGALIFVFGVASVAFGKKEGIEAAFAIGGSLLLGLIIASVASNALINPAVALGTGSLSVDFSKGGAAWYALSCYIVAPILGAIAGAWLYRLLRNDVERVQADA